MLVRKHLNQIKAKIFLQIRFPFSKDAILKKVMQINVLTADFQSDFSLIPTAY